MLFARYRTSGATPQAEEPLAHPVSSQVLRAHEPTWPVSRYTRLRASVAANPEADWPTQLASRRHSLNRQLGVNVDEIHNLEQSSQV